MMRRLSTLLIAWSLAATGCQCGATPGDGPGAGTSPTTPVAASSASAAGSTGSVQAAGSAAASATASLDQPMEAEGPPLDDDKLHDILIQGGTVIDGSGRRALRADVVVDRDTISHVGRVSPQLKARTTIDATNKVVTPGFIDTHSHADPEGSNANLLAQGVTSACLGQDGRSASDDRVRYWAKRVGKKRLAVNALPFVGHATVRGLAKVSVKKDPDDKALERLERLVDQELEDGAWGLTTGLEYVPGTLAKAPELAAIARPVGKRDGVIMSHLRSEDDDRIDASLDELVAQGKAGAARVHVAHVKVVYGMGVDRAEALLAKLRAAREDGVSITADIYPYSASYTTISIVFPDFALPPNSYKRVKRDKREELAEYLREKVKRRNGPEATLFGSGPWRGKTLAVAAKETGKPFEDLLIDDIGPGGASAAYFVMDEALQSRLLLDPFVMIGTDGSAGSRHPRGYGTFAKVIREQVVDNEALPLVEAVRKMTGLPAETLRLDRAKRGQLQAGWAADVLVFDPAAVKDRATFEEPHQLADGMDWVLVNGVAAVKAGKLTKGRGGRVVLKRPE